MTIDESNARIIELLIEGKTTKEIAATVFLSTRTVESRLKRMRKQHNVITTIQLVLKITKQKNTENHIAI